MCRSSIHHYDLRANVRNWAVSYLLVALLHFLAFASDSDETLYASGLGLGVLTMWALEIGREWLKTWVPHYD